MEHRWSGRSSVNINILLYHNGIPVVRCETRDIGKEGMFVESGQVMYSRNTVLDVEFELESGSRRTRYRVSVMVMHICREGMGLLFLETESEAFQALGDWVKRIGAQRSSGGLKTKKSLQLDQPLAVAATV